METIKLPFLDYIGAKLNRYEKGMAEVTLKVEERHHQHLGIVHGGVIATLIDNTGWYAVMSTLDKGYTSVTAEMKINYLKPARGDCLKAVAAVKHKGHSTAFATIELFDGETVIAFATITCAIIQKNRS